MQIWYPNTHPAEQKLNSLGFIFRTCTALRNFWDHSWQKNWRKKWSSIYSKNLFPTLLLPDREGKQSLPKSGQAPLNIPISKSYFPSMCLQILCLQRFQNFLKAQDCSFKIPCNFPFFINFSKFQLISLYK